MVGRRWLVTALVAVLAGLGAPRMLQAQQAAPTSALASASPVDPKMRELATLQLEVDATRDEYFARLSVIHEDVPKHALRKEFSKAIETVCQKYGMTTEQFEREIFLVSSDDAALAAFDNALRVLTAEPVR